MIKQIIAALFLISTTFAQDFNPDGWYIACSNGADFHSSTSVRVEKNSGTVSVVTDGEELGPFSQPSYDLFAAGRLRINFTNLQTGVEQSLRVNFMGESATASLNDSGFEYSCFSAI